MIIITMLIVAVLVMKNIKEQSATTEAVVGTGTKEFLQKTEKKINNASELMEQSRQQIYDTD